MSVRAARRRRRRQLRLLRTVVVLLLVLVVSIRLASGGGHPHHAAAAPSRPAHGEAAAASSATPHDPFTTPAAQSFLAAHPHITAAVLDRRTGVVWSVRGQQAKTVASIMKVDILATLLDEDQAAHRQPDGDTMTLATEMIENSDNAAAQDLWDRIGGSSGVGRYNGALGLKGTSLNTQGYWGLSTSDAMDQVTLLRSVSEGANDQAPLTAEDRGLALKLMEHVEADQRWGITAGLPSGATVAIKNGWLPLSSGRGWEVNSDGVVSGDGYDDDIAILSSGSATEAAGIAEVEQLSRLVWPAVRA